MKKLMLAAAVFAAVSFASCGNKNAENADSANLDTIVDTTVAVEAVGDSTGETVVAAETVETAVVADQPEVKK